MYFPTHPFLSVRMHYTSQLVSLLFGTPNNETRTLLAFPMGVAPLKRRHCNEMNLNWWMLTGGEQNRHTQPGNLTPIDLVDTLPELVKTNSRFYDALYFVFLCLSNDHMYLSTWYGAKKEGCKTIKGTSTPTSTTHLHIIFSATNHICNKQEGQYFASLDTPAEA